MRTFVQPMISALGSVNSTLDAIAEVPRPIASYDGFVPARVVTVGQLVDQGVIELRGSGRVRTDGGDAGAASIIDGRMLRSGDVAGVPGLADGSDVAPLDATRPGDVLVTTDHAIAAAVDSAGWHLIGGGIHRLRVLTDQLEPAYLAAVLPGSWNERFMAGGSMRRAKIRDLEIPLTSREVQAEYVEAIRVLAELGREAATLADQSAEVQVAMLDLLRYADGDE